MPHDPILVSDTRAWFHKARNDLLAAEVDLTTVPPLCQRLIHGYGSVDYDILWDATAGSLPGRIESLDHVLGEEPDA